LVHASDRTIIKRKGCVRNQMEGPLLGQRVALTSDKMLMGQGMEPGHPLVEEVLTTRIGTHHIVPTGQMVKVGSLAAASLTTRSISNLSKEHSLATLNLVAKSSTIVHH
jgi:hypothetical protein